MKTKILAAVASASVLCSLASLAQNNTLPDRSPVQASVQDGGARQTLESIFIPPKPNAPFTCMLHTEWARKTEEGGTVTMVNQRRIARQSSGRFYQERWLLVPKNGQVESQMNVIQIADPNEHALYQCFTGPKVCTITNYGGRTTTVYKPSEPSTGPLPDHTGDVVRESLGNSNEQGVDAIGTRITTNVAAWAIGNDRPLSIIREFWFAPSLGINVLSKISNPHFGMQTFTVTDLRLAEPDPQLFELPSGFQVQDQRAPAPSR